IANILTLYTKYNGRRKPELLNEYPYSLVNYNEFENVVGDYNKLRDKAQLLYKTMAPQYKDAYYQLVLHPVIACANLNEMYLVTAKNKLYAAQGRAATNKMADSVKKLFEKDAEISHYYNKIMANGKWDHMMDQTHISYTYWQQPRVDKVPDVTHIDIPVSPQMGVAIEGSTAWWPTEQTKSILPEFYQGQSGHYIEVFNRGQGAFNFTASAAASYVTIKPKNGKVNLGEKLWVNIDWSKAPKGITRVPITIADNQGNKVTVGATINKVAQNTSGFYENNGYVSIEAAHYAKAVNTGDAKWMTIPNYGKTLSGVTPIPVTAKTQTPEGNSPHLEYTVNLIDTGMMDITAYISPTIDFTNSTGLRYAVSIDNEQPQIVNINADKSQKGWYKDVSDNIKKLVTKHHVSTPGKHILKYWMVDPGVVLQKIVVNAGGEMPSYLGPPESYFHKTAK
ncbi:MAG: glycosyl hydrolase, partial [Mucilaginibacter sp.]